MTLRNRLLRQQFKSHNHLGAVRDFSLIQHKQRIVQIQLKHMEASLQIMNSAFKNNLKIQQIYLDLIKAKGKKAKIKTKDIKNVYKILSDNKTDQIYFQKVYQQEQKQRKSSKEQFCMTSSMNGSIFKQLAFATTIKGHSSDQTVDKQTFSSSQNSQAHVGGSEDLKQSQNQFLNSIIATYRRLYSRLIQAIVRKITFYILNKNQLQKLILHVISEMTKKLQTLVRRLTDFKDCKFLFQVIKIIYEENFILEQKIYEVIVNQGHVISLEQFFRVNGILLQQAEPLKRNSRKSIISIGGLQRFSIMSKQSWKNQEQSKIRDPAPLQKKQNIKNVKKVYNQNNILFVQRANKQIQQKYALALDKISDLMTHRQQFDTTKGQNETNQEKQPSDQDGQKKKSSVLNKKTSNSQYFSTQFKQVICELDDKKGKTFIVSTSRRQSFSEMRRSKTMMSLLNPFKKINKLTVSLQNPVNVARMMSKNLSKFSPASSQLSYMQRTGHDKKSENRKTQINKLLKIYENNHKENHLIDVLFDCSSVDQEHRKLQKNFIKLNIMAKLKQKRLSKLKQQSSQNDQGSDSYQGHDLMRQIEAEYQNILEIKINRHKNNKQNHLDVETPRKIQQEILFSMKNKKKRKNITRQKSAQEQKIKGPDQNLNNQKNYLQSLISKKKQKKHQQVRQQNNPMQKQETPQKGDISQNFERFRNINLNNKKKQIKDSNNAAEFQILDLKQVYGQYTNPLTKTYGYYSQKHYSSVRNSLQRFEENTLNLKKGILKRNQHEIGFKVAFYDKIKLNTKAHLKTHRFRNDTKNQRNERQRIVQQSEAKQSYERQKYEKSKDQNEQNPNTKLNRKQQITIFQHKLLKKCIFNSPFQSEGAQLKGLRNYGNDPQNLKKSKKVESQKKDCFATSFTRQKNQIKRRYVNRNERNVLSRDFFLNSSKINNLNQYLSSDDLDVIVERYLQKASKLALSPNRNQTGKIQFPLFFESQTSTPRNSFKRIKQLYSTQRRVKIQ